MTWHADRAMLHQYQAGALGSAHAASVEAHLGACAECRTAMATVADRPRLERGWSAIADRLDERSITRAERVLVRLGISEHHARLVVMTPSLRSPSVVALVAVLAFVSVTNVIGGGVGGGAFYAFLVLAPLLPLAGVAAAFGTVGDPVRELSASTPVPAFELLLVRTLAIVVATTVLTTVAAAPLPSGWQAGAWLLPALGLTALALALSTWVPAHWSGIGLGLAWVVAATVGWRMNRFDPDVVSRFVALRPAGQLMFAALTVIGAVIVVLRREALDLRRFA